jgi:hypothetical protein
MKQVGKIGVFLFSLMILMNVFAFINLELNGVYRFGGAIPAMISFLVPWSISYSKWANDNIWNTKTSKPTNTSYTSSKDVVEPIDEPVDDNRNILSNINSPSLSNPVENNNDVLQKIEELKRQIESLQASLKTNDSNKLPEEKIDYGEYWKKREKFNPDDFKPKMKDEDMNMFMWIAIVILILVCFLLIIAQG